MKLMYFPGCTLKTTALNYEKSAIEVAKKMDIELIELNRWNCCGVVFNLAVDSAMHHVAAVRDLIRAQQMSREIGDNKLVTLCSMCFNTLKRVNELMKMDSEKLETINKFMDDEEDYECGIEVLHFLEVIRDIIGFEKIEKLTIKPLKNLKVAPYYGCTLIRPKGIGIDNPENPRILEDLIKALGAEVVEFPYKIKCCSAYDVVYDRKIAEERTREIRKAASRWGANIIVTTCPLCHYNLNLPVRAPEIPVVYFTELMAVSFGVDEILDPEVRKVIYSLMGEV
ncbi:MAG: heterodisulfide reductase, subunit B [Candidatus Methanomethylicota archaeon]|mgnify:CR=1 FL=1|uniref:Heterodisulfide reductase, subunit B n=1 Tax=Thermoproteota archaeon TaxID=2056631 RepID=A0A497EVC4_9CREN|nr:MAG: heterodisulfide reductase, subunit B [Candidatus Verstraetearchaeota archaeon]